MKIYATGFQAFQSPRTVVHVAPGAFDSSGPVDWFDESGAPKTINVIFAWGEAEVSDALGKFMIANGAASKTKIAKAA